MSERERTDAGTFAETVTLEDVRDVFDAVRGPVVTSSDVADTLGCTTEAARQKLRRLVDRGEVDRRKTGRTVVYWRATDEERRETPRDAARSDPGNESGGDLDTPARPPRPESDDALAEDVRAYLEDNDVPPKTEHGRDAVVDVFRYLREHGTAKTSEIREALASAHADRYSNKKAMWESVRRYLENIPGIEKRGYGEYGYAGDEAVRGVL
jgi:ribosomal protein S25